MFYNISVLTYDRYSNYKSSKAKNKYEIISTSAILLNVTNLVQLYSSKFYYATNIIKYFRYTYRLGNNTIKARRLIQFQDYYNRFINRLSTFEKDVKKKYNSIKKYYYTRYKSFEYNKKSYFKKTDISSFLELNNIIILKDLKEGLLVNIDNEKKRLIFFRKGTA